ncbi:steroid delta-isomerase [Litorivivens lipolytica]|uniref:Steroid delta-isomerase n=1 Tax=Litorivivens lipolytica TaxID=1524264 RepID=A0A7W4W3I5_9GAMM|nr:nuclear transport factor 2 family protein [Litorivivens lipolytica]MBB3046229.1 steroid delta-isomerase [Litorivivens lipolytica]
MENTDKIAAVHRYVEAFASGDMNIIRDLYAEDATVEDPVGSDIHKGMEAIVKFYEPSLGKIKLNLSGDPRCAGDEVAFPFQVDASGMTIDVIDVFKFNADGKVCSMRAFWGPENMKS